MCIAIQVGLPQYKTFITLHQIHLNNVGNAMKQEVLSVLDHGTKHVGYQNIYSKERVI